MNLIVNGNPIKKRNSKNIWIFSYGNNKVGF
jgi:hypothetical protein